MKAKLKSQGYLANIVVYKGEIDRTPILGRFCNLSKHKQINKKTKAYSVF
jgi:hypothetical protein